VEQIAASGLKKTLASGKRLVKYPVPGVLAVAGTSVLASRKPDSIGDHSFQDIRMDCSKGTKGRRWGGASRGLSACRRASILSKTAGAGDETSSFFNGLISQPA
jgi:hypothetical protein